MRIFHLLHVTCFILSSIGHDSDICNVHYYLQNVNNNKLHKDFLTYGINEQTDKIVSTFWTFIHIYIRYRLVFKHEDINEKKKVKKSHLAKRISFFLHKTIDYKER